MISAISTAKNCVDPGSHCLCRSRRWRRPPGLHRGSSYGPWDVRFNNSCRGSWWFGPWEEVGQVGPQTSEWWAEAVACWGLFGVRQSGPPPLSAMLDSIVTMDETMVCYHMPQSKKQSQQWIEKGQPGPIKANQTDVARLFHQQRPHLYAHRTQGLHRQCRIHCEGPGCLHEAFQKEEACVGWAALVFPWGQHPGPHRRHRPGLISCPQRSGPPPPALFAGSRAGGLLLVSAREGQAGTSHLGPEQPQGVGRGHKKYICCRIRHRLSVVVRSLPKVYWDRRRIRWEIIRNKRPPDYNCCRFIEAVWFVFEFTSYADQKHGMEETHQIHPWIRRHSEPFLMTNYSPYYTAL